MGRPRQYESDAARQRACRARLAAQRVLVERRALDGLQMRLDRLQQAIRKAAEGGDATARACRAVQVETMPEKLIRHFEG